ncbi:MAG: YlbF family regulator [Clostridia bacterium]|nr:YlbF family regulator [Clostridia bacterium]
MSNVYDAANKLADEIRQSEEFLKYREARKAVLANPDFKSRIEEFEKIRYDVQVLSMEKGSTDPEKMKKLQELYTILVENKDIKDYFDLEVNFNVMVADVNKIIAESMEEIFRK